MFGFKKGLRNYNDKDLRCSFCNKPKEEVEKLFSNPEEMPVPAYIRNECVEVCNVILEDDKKRRTTK